VTCIRQQDQPPGGSHRLGWLTVGALGAFFVLHDDQPNRVPHQHEYTLYSNVTGHLVDGDSVLKGNDNVSRRPGIQLRQELH
jgi:hypothetical protein